MHSLHFMMQTLLIPKDLMLLLLHMTAIEHVLRHGIVRIVKVEGNFLFGCDDFLC